MSDEPIGVDPGAAPDTPEPTVPVGFSPTAETVPVPGAVVEETPTADVLPEAPAQEPTDSEQVIDPEPVEEPVPEDKGPIFSDFGDYEPNPNVSDDQGILIELTEDQLRSFSKDNPSLALSNFSMEELDTLYTHIERQVARAQEGRAEQVNNGGGAGLFSGRGDNEELVYITQLEGQAMQAINEYRDTTSPYRDKDLFEDGSLWTNLPKVGDNKIAMARLDYEKSNDPIMKIKGRLGMAVEYNNPMWSSGIHLVVEGAEAMEQLALSQKILAEKAEMGRDSSGYVYSASALYLNMPVINFTLDHVRSSTIGTTDPEVLKRVLLITDIDAIALAMASANMPKGFLLERPCLELLGGCGVVTKRQANLRRMLFVRRSKITEDQAAFMSKRSGRVDIKTVMNYQAAMRPDVSRIAPLKNGLSVRFKIPTIAEYERIASSWLDRMDQQSRKVASSNASQSEREAFLIKASRISVLMAYGHWIDAILEQGEELASDPVVMIQREGEDGSEQQYASDVKMQKLLASLASDNEIIELIVDALQVFINEMTIATPVINKVKCPHCGTQMQGDDQSKHPHLVNLNAVEVFFTLLHLKIQRLSN